MRGTTPIYFFAERRNLYEKTPLPRRARTQLRGTTLHLYSAAEIDFEKYFRYDGNKKPPSTLGQGRNRGTTLHYTFGVIRNGDPRRKLSEKVRLRSSRVMDYKFRGADFHRASALCCLFLALVSITACHWIRLNGSIQEKI